MGDYGSFRGLKNYFRWDDFNNSTLRKYQIVNNVWTILILSSISAFFLAHRYKPRPPKKPTWDLPNLVQENHISSGDKGSLLSA